MTKKIFIARIMILIFFAACDIGLNEGPTLFYRFIVTVDTDLDSLRIGRKYYNKDSEYPDTLLNLYTTSDLSSVTTIYPVTDTGEIHFELYRGEGYHSVPVTSFGDSLTIYTPIDTTIIFFESFSGLNTIIINPQF